MNKNGICTIVSLNYFAQAVSLMKSIKKYHKDVNTHILIVDRTQNEEVKKQVENYRGLADIKYVADIGIKDFANMSFIYDVVELNTAVKPFYLEYLLHTYQYETIMYIDPDILLFHSLSTIYQQLETHSIILTPHLLSDEEDVDTKISKLDDFLQYGIYNLGFLALKNDDAGRRLIVWWEKQLTRKCFLNPKKFLAWDQKWMDFTPALFNQVYVLRDPGYNVAFWNLQKRYISKKDGEFFVNDSYPLVFYHYSHYHLSRRDRIADVEPEERAIPIANRNDVAELFSVYYDSVTAAGHSFFSKITYGFNHYTDGSPIEKVDRQRYYHLEKDGVDMEDPFEMNSEQLEDLYEEQNAKVV